MVCTEIKVDSAQKATEKFWRKILQPVEGCWLWQGRGRTGSLGYGAAKIPLVFGFGRKNSMAHRIAFFLSRGYWAENVRHTCDIPLCCRPDHLIEGTQEDNVHDCISRGRARNGNIKLNPKIWEAIRQSSGPSRLQAAKYGVHEAHVRKIRRGITGLIYRP